MPAQNSAFENAISKFPISIQWDLRDILSQGGVIPLEFVTSCLEKLTIDIETLMIRLLPVAASYACVPISGFYVGAVALGMPSEKGLGSLYLGANMEFSKESLNFCIHGEQSAMNNAWLNGEVGLQSIAINAAPCGYCRQFLYEISTSIEGLTILCKVNNNPDDELYVKQPLTYYLPDAFGPQHLGLQGRLMDSVSHGLTMSNEGVMVQEALDSVNQSYAPYTKNYSGIAIKLSNGQIYSGRYAENAAYNPSMSPLQSALAFMNMDSLAQDERVIAQAVLIEIKNKISQKKATEAVLSSISPSVSFQYLTID